MRFSFKPVERLLTDNAPVLLSGVAIVGSVTTAYLAATAAFRSSAKFQEADVQRYRLSDDVEGVTVYLTMQEKVKIAWPYFLPAAGSATLTIAAIVCAHRVSMSRAAAMAAAYSLSEQKFSDYRKKIEERFGLKEKEAVDSEVIKDQMEKTKQPSVVFVGGNNTMCFDSYSGRYFTSSMDEIKGAMNETNLEVIRDRYATLETFWNLIGLDPTNFSDEFGWTVDCPLDVKFSTTITKGDMPALVITYDAEPVRRWNHLG